MENFLRIEDSTLIVFDCDQFAIKNSETIFTAIKEKLETEPIKHILFDFEKTVYVSSAGLRQFSSLLQYCNENNITLEISNISVEIHRIFDMSGYGQAFKFIN